jgi:hypothetical protein
MPTHTLNDQNTLVDFCSELTFWKLTISPSIIRFWCQKLFSSSLKPWQLAMSFNPAKIFQVGLTF